VAAGAALLLDDETFDGDVVRTQVVPLLGARDRIARMADAAQHVGTRTGTENLVVLIDRALAEK
jgi:UDP-N-acetylglucosamine--N-acetylmuramyl-(pentapeptide) pyrophosphoryl-undecaprenol N-acetylglucosamine transferase